MLADIFSFVITPFAFFTYLWTVIFATEFSSYTLLYIDTGVCLIGALLAVINIPLIPHNVVPIAAYGQRTTIGLVGCTLFAIFVGHAYGIYLNMRVCEFAIHLTATMSLLTGVILRSRIGHIPLPRRRFRMVRPTGVEPVTPTMSR